jgi:hypothetical protein
VSRKANGTIQTLSPVHKSSGASCYYEFHLIASGKPLHLTSVMKCMQHTREGYNFDAFIKVNMQQCQHTFHS